MLVAQFDWIFRKTNILSISYFFFFHLLHDFSYLLQIGRTKLRMSIWGHPKTSNLVFLFSLSVETWNEMRIGTENYFQYVWHWKWDLNSKFKNNYIVIGCEILSNICTSIVVRCVCFLLNSIQCSMNRILNDEVEK